MFIKISAPIFSIIARFVRKDHIDDVEYSDSDHSPIRRIRVAPAAGEGAYIVACNGVDMGIYYDAAARVEKAVLIEPHALLAANAAMPTASFIQNALPPHTAVENFGLADLVVVHGQEDASLSFISDPSFGAISEGPYPDWLGILSRCVAVSRYPLEDCIVSAKSLARFDFSTEQPQPLRLFACADDRALIVRNLQHPNFIGLTMRCVSRGGGTIAGDDELGPAMDIRLRGDVAVADDPLGDL